MYHTTYLSLIFCCIARNKYETEQNNNNELHDKIFHLSHFQSIKLCIQIFRNCFQQMRYLKGIMGSLYLGTVVYIISPNWSENCYNYSLYKSEFQ